MVFGTVDSSGAARLDGRDKRYSDSGRHTGMRRANGMKRLETNLIEMIVRRAAVWPQEPERVRVCDSLAASYGGPAEG